MLKKYTMVTEKIFRLRGERSYSQARRSGNLVFISGTVSWDDDFNVVGGNDVRLQIENIYRDIGRTLQHFGLDFSSLVRETIYTLDMELLLSVSDIRTSHFANGGTPAATWVVVSRLVNPKFILEIEAVALLPAGDGETDNGVARAVEPPRHFRRRSVESAYGFSQAVQAGSLLFVAGLVSWNARAEPLNVGNFAAQLTNIYEELGEILAGHGAGFSAIAKETIFTCDMTSLVSAAPLRGAYFGEHPPPASTWVQVERLVHPDLLLEVEVIAQLR